MKISLYTEPGKTLPAALRPIGAMSGRYATIGLTLLQNPDGSFEIVSASRSVAREDHVTRSKERIAELDAIAVKDAEKAAQKEDEKAARRVAVMAQKMAEQKAKVEAKQARIDAKKALKKAQQ